MSNEAATEPKRRAFLTDLFIRIVREKPLGTVGGIIVVILLFTGIFADFLAPYGFNEAHTADSMVPPSDKYLLGTDNLGRDMLSRVIFGARISLIVGLSAAAISVGIAMLIGILCGFLGGKFDIIMQRFVDAWMCLPGLVILIVIISLLGVGMQQVIVALGFRYGVTGSRVVRGAAMSVKENAYVEAATATGCSPIRIMGRHMLPNVMAPIIILFTTQLPVMILIEASLSFLGFGIPPPTPSWGGMLGGTALGYMYMAPWMAVWPGLALAIVVYGVNMFGDALRDLLDPKLRGGVGRYGRTDLKAVKQSQGLR
jgi:peptide/nickel transport system permease protein